MKKLATALCLSTVLLASGAAQAGWEGNWLVGGSLDFGKRTGHLNFSSTTPALGTVAALNTDMSRSGWGGGILGGYQARCNGWLLGGELAVDWMNHNSSNSYAYTQTNGLTFVGSANYHQDAVVGLTARFGYEVATFFLPYLRAGIETSRDQLNVSVAQINVAAPITGNISGSRRDWRFIGGVGAELPIPVLAGLSFRIEYNYHSNGRSVSANGVASDGTTGLNASTKQHANTGKASLVYNFI